VSFFYEDNTILSVVLDVEDGKIQGFPWIKNFKTGIFKPGDIFKLEDTFNEMKQYPGAYGYVGTLGQEWRITQINIVPTSDLFNVII
jgi:hypothetical protein